jgi:intein-encoded DNA endonuclease-like protein
LGLLHDATERKTTFRIAQKNQKYLNFIKSELLILGARSWIYKEGKDRNVWILEFSKKFLNHTRIISIQDKIDYLCGYFDAEGGIAKSSKVRFYLYYCQKNFDELLQLKNYLEELKIGCGVIHNPSKKRDPNFWRFYIAAKSYVEFAKIIGSKHPDKSKMLRMKI